MHRLFVKSYCLLIGLSLLLSSCENLEFRESAFQADIDYQLWMADSFSAAYNNNGQLVITGTNNAETIILSLTNDAPGTYLLGPDEESKAEIEDGFGTLFSTAVVPDEEVSVYQELGTVIITERSNSPDRLTGEFFFIAYDAEGKNPTGVSNGIFFQVPVRTSE
jgi:hypothetical protein